MSKVCRSQWEARLKLESEKYELLMKRHVLNIKLKQVEEDKRTLFYTRVVRGEALQQLLGGCLTYCLVHSICLSPWGSYSVGPATEGWTSCWAGADFPPKKPPENQAKQKNVLNTREMYLFKGNILFLNQCLKYGLHTTEKYIFKENTCSSTCASIMSTHKNTKHHLLVFKIFSKIKMDYSSSQK